MNEVFGYSDIDCPDPNPDDTSDGQTWPGSTPNPIKRSEIPSQQHSTSEADITVEIESELDWLDDGEYYHEMEKRVAGVANMSPKWVRVNPGAPVEAPSYPSFPLDPTYPWDGIENGRWDTIPRYFSRTSTDCANWTVAQTAQPWMEDTSIGRVRTKYQTEHVFEAQLLGNFFNEWIEKGNVTDQVARNGTTQPAISSIPIASPSWVQMYIKTAGALSPWPDKFIKTVVLELGSLDHLTRFVIWESRPNQMKASMLGGKSPTSKTKYLTKTPEQQLCSVKEWEMTFQFLAQPDVWNAFCGTYEGVYNLMGQSDTAYATEFPNNPPVHLQHNWAEYIRVVLDSMVENASANLEYYYFNRRELPAGDPASALF